MDKKMELITKKIENLSLNSQILQDDIERIKEFIQYSAVEGTVGIAAFISGYRNLFLTYPINYRFTNQIIFDNEIYKAPLTKLLATQPSQIYLVLYPSKSSLYYLQNSKLYEKEPSILPLNNNETLKEYLVHVKDIYWPYFRTDDVKNVFLIGDKQSIDIFFSVLAKTAIQKIKAKIQLPKNAPVKIIEKTAIQLRKKFNILDPAKRIGYARILAQRGLAVFGPNQVFKTLKEGKVREILISPKFTKSGWRCVRCKLLIAGAEKLCIRCKGKLEQVKLLKNAIIRDAKQLNIQITRVNHNFLNNQGEGIGAILRFS